jgi:hypothetical protein
MKHPAHTTFAARRTVRAVSAAATVAAAVAVPVISAAPAMADTCDAYSQHCTSHLPGTPVHHDSVVPSTGQSSSGTTLPFTGAEAALMGIAGIGAIGVGGGLLVASRKRRQQSA